MKSGNLKFLEHPVPLQACKGTALPLHVQTKEGANSLVQIEAANRAWVINTGEYLNKKHIEDQFVNTVTSHEGNQTNSN